MGWYFYVLKKYATFEGRASRPEFWLWTLLNFIVCVVLYVISVMIHDQYTVLYYIYALATLIPNIAVAARRLHDTDRSGWWQLIVLVPLIGIILLLVWYCFRGTEGSNRFGPPAPTSPDAAPTPA
jgi:uncharacterized membrane protein YhaH (DUF805 family)